MKQAGAFPLLAALVLAPGVLTDDVAEGIRRLPCDSPGDIAAELLEDVRTGRAKLCDLIRCGERVGFVIYAITRFGELICHAALGCDKQTNLIDSIIPELERIARHNGCTAVRFHTVRPGLVSLASEHGYRVSEVIMRKAVA